MRVCLGVLVLRISLGSILFVHGAEKLGWTGFWQILEQESLLNYTYQQLIPFMELVHMTFGFLTETQVIWLVSCAALIEFFGGILLMIGFLTRPAAMMVSFVMCGALYYHSANGFFAAYNGYEWALLCFAASIALFFIGPGRFSLSGLLGAAVTADSQV